MNGLLLQKMWICHDASEVLQLIGWVLTVFKIAIPLIIIGLGLIDLGKAAVSSKPEEIKKCATSLIWRLVGGIAIFFIPAIIMLVFGFVSGFSDAKGQVDWNTCYKCITVPWNGDCTSAVNHVRTTTACGNQDSCY